MTNMAVGGTWAGKRVVVLSPTPTSPQNFGNRRSFYNFFRRIKEQGARIAFVHYPSEFDWRESLPSEDQRVMQEQWDECFLIPPSRELHSAALGYHHELDEWWDPAIGTFLDWYFRVAACDVFIVNYTWLSKALLHAPSSALKILHTHDRFSGRRELLEQHGIEAEFFYISEETEKRALQRADVVWAVKEEEEHFFRDLSGRPTYTFPHVENRKYLFSARKIPQEHLVFGLMGARNSINTTNYERFLRFLKNYLIETHLAANFVVAGSLCDKLSPEEFPFATFMGEMADVAEFYEACDVVVVPMSFSTGLKIKVGEAAGYGKGIIGYRHAFEGYLRSHRFHNLNSDAAICDAISTVVDDASIISQLEEASVRIQLDGERRAKRCLELSLPVNATIGEQVLFVVQGAALENDAIVDHLCDVAEFIGYQARPAILVVGATTAQSEASLARLARRARCYIGKNALSHLQFEARQQLRRVATVLSLEHLSVDDKILFVLDWADIPDTWLADARAILHRCNLLDHSTPRPKSCNTSRLIRMYNVGGICDVHEPCAAVIELPLFRNPWQSQVFRRLAATARSGVSIIVANDMHLVELSDVLGRYIRTSVLENCTVYMHNPTRKRHRAFVVKDASDALSITSDWLQNSATPSVVVDLSGDPSRYSAMSALCQRLRIEFLSLPCIRGRRLHHDLDGRDNAVSGVIQRLLEVLVFPQTAQRPENEECADQFASENGWAALWRLIEQLRSGETTLIGRSSIWRTVETDEGYHPIAHVDG